MTARSLFVWVLAVLLLGAVPGTSWAEQEAEPPAAEAATGAEGAPADEAADPESEVTTRGDPKKAYRNPKVQAGSHRTQTSPTASPPADSPKVTRHPSLRIGSQREASDVGAPDAGPSEGAPRKPLTPRRQQDEGSESSDESSADEDAPNPAIRRQPSTPQIGDAAPAPAMAPIPTAPPSLRMRRPSDDAGSDEGTSSSASVRRPRPLSDADDAEADADSEDSSSAARLARQKPRTDDDDAFADVPDPTVEVPTKLTGRTRKGAPITRALNRLSPDLEVPESIGKPLKQYFRLASTESPPGERLAQLDDLNGMLTRLRAQARKQKATDLENLISEEQELIAATVKDRAIMQSPDVANATHALELKRLGLRPSAAARVGVTDDDAQGELRPLGSGSMNTVLAGKFRRNGRDFDGVFKADGTEAPSDMAEAIGIPKSTPRYAYRNIATTKLDELLDFDEPITTPSQMAIHGGKLGTVSEMAKGVAPKGRLVPGGTEVPGLPVEMVQASIDRGEPVNVGIRKGKVYQLEDSMYDVNYDDPRLRRDLVRLQLMDSIAGQVDRSMGNYLVQQDPNTRKVLGVKGIDNDLAWGSELRKVRREPGVSKLGYLPNDLPPYVDQETHDAVMSLTPSRLAKAMSGLLTADEISAATERLTDVQDHLAGLAKAGRILKKDDDWTRADVTAELMKPVRPGEHSSYLGRDMSMQAEKRRAGIVDDYPPPRRLAETAAPPPAE